MNIDWLRDWEEGGSRKQEGKGGTDGEREINVEVVKKEKKRRERERGRKPRETYIHSKEVETLKF